MLHWAPAMSNKFPKLLINLPTAKGPKPEAATRVFHRCDHDVHCNLSRRSHFRRRLELTCRWAAETLAVLLRPALSSAARPAAGFQRPPRGPVAV